MEGEKTNPFFPDDKVQTAFPTDCSHAILYRRLKLRYFFRSLKIEGCYRAHKENFICGQRTVGYMVGAPACGWVKTGRTPSAGNIEKATNPRKNERGEDFVPWFDRDKMADACLIARRLGIRRGWAGPN